MLNFLWGLPQHKAAFQTIAADAERFLGFAHGIINHSNHLLTEALAKLSDIRKTQVCVRVCGRARRALVCACVYVRVCCHPPPHAAAPPHPRRVPVPHRTAQYRSNASHLPRLRVGWVCMGCGYRLRWLTPRALPAWGKHCARSG
jgi:hypothetical protein